MNETLKLSDEPQIAAEDANSANNDAVEHHVMDILNPSLHHHDLIQSYVHVDVGSDSKQDPEKFEEPSKEGHSDNYSRIVSNSNARYPRDKEKKSGDKKGKSKSDAAIESEMKIQKSRKK
ncbi:hypothetical protein PUN28_015799 [Cardiocondyla obscurior]|uniref:Uncharacterized protein n=1 Tax=Cardiocondyla obscurior TaxID=286306 RepID=A0AAW2EPD5_9HYME